MLDFKNKNVVITGGGSGIGRAASLAFGKRGAFVHILEWNEEQAAKVVKEIEEGGAAQDATADSADKSEHTDKQVESSQIKMFIQELMPKESIVKMESKGETNTNLFVVHPIEGVVISLQSLAKEVKAQVFGLQCVLGFQRIFQYRPYRIQSLLRLLFLR